MLKNYCAFLKYCLVLVLFSFPLSANAELVTWEFKGKLGWGTHTGLVPYELKSVTYPPVVATLTFDSALVDLNPNNSQGYYNSDSGLIELSFDVNGFVVPLTNVAIQVVSSGRSDGASIWIYANMASGYKHPYYEGNVEGGYINLGLQYLIRDLGDDSMPINPPKSRLGYYFTNISSRLVGRHTSGSMWSSNRDMSLSSITRIESQPVNMLPIADAGLDQQPLIIGETVMLDGTQSSDPDGDPITYLWEIIQSPIGSAAVLDNPTSSTPSFVVDVHDVGGYVIQLTVTDAQGASASDTMSVSFNNLPPVAVAQIVGGDVRLIGEEVCFDGSGSSDANLDELNYSWSITSRAPNSTAQLYNQISIVSCFIIDQDGAYDISLIVNDGFVDSQPMTVTIKTVQYRIAELLAEAESTIGSIPDSGFKNDQSKRRDKLIGYTTTKGNGGVIEHDGALDKVLKLMVAGDYLDARNKLNAVIQATNGCVDGGVLHANDVIDVCGPPDGDAEIGQNQVYPILVEARDLLLTLIP